jgi:hypothetical protein
MKIRFIREFPNKFPVGTVKEFVNPNDAEFYLKNNFAEIVNEKKETKPNGTKDA